jgi:ATP-dependent phosphofructokinase / diphosphate-dependent phosphofructokinase
LQEDFRLAFVSPKKIRRIAINTGGGDAPGLNAVIRAVTLSAIRRGWEVIGIRRGFGNLLTGEPCIKMNNDTVRGIAHLGGTILGTTNKGNPFEHYVKSGRGKARLAAEIVVEELKKLKIDGLIAIGGDGSLGIAFKLMQMGIPVIGVPKTIDNDLNATERTFGFDTAVSTATECLDKLHSTAQAHERAMVVEVMGRYAGWIALHAGISTSADVILIPEIKYDMKKVANYLLERKKSGRPYAIIVVSEGACEVGKGLLFAAKKEKGREQRLGGAGHHVAECIEKMTGIETRAMVLGHIQRGGSPTTYDRLLALRYGAAAVRMAEAGQWGKMVSFRPPLMTSEPLEAAIRERKVVPTDCDTVTTARDLGICLGD